MNKQMTNILRITLILLSALPLIAIPNHVFAGGGGKKKSKTYKWCFYLQVSDKDKKKFLEDPFLRNASLEVAAYTWYGTNPHNVTFHLSMPYAYSGQQCFHSKDKKLNLVGKSNKSGPYKDICDRHNDANYGTRHVKISTYKDPNYSGIYLNCDI